MQQTHKLKLQNLFQMHKMWSTRSKYTCFTDVFNWFSWWNMCSNEKYSLKFKKKCKSTVLKDKNKSYRPSQFCMCIFMWVSRSVSHLITTSHRMAKLSRKEALALMITILAGIWPSKQAKMTVGCWNCMNHNFLVEPFPQINWNI